MSEFLWNQLDLEPPPAISVEIKSSEPSIYNIQRKLIGTCHEVDIKLLNTFFKEEATFISRFIYRYRNQFRFLKGFQVLRKVYQALLRIPKLKIKQLFYELLTCISKDFIPCISVVEYAMLRLQSLSFLLSRIIVTCQEFFTFVRSYIKGSVPWETFLTFQASISRIWVLCHHLLQNSDKWYETLYLLYLISDKSKSWLPPSYRLPVNLLSWVNHQLIRNNQIPIVKENIYKLSVVNKTKDNGSSSDSEAPSKESSEVKMDQDINPPVKMKKRKRKLKQKKMSQPTDVKSLIQLKKFLETEIALRSNSNLKNNCVTKNLDPMEWDILKTILKKSVDKIEKKPSATEKILGKVRQTLQLAIS